MPWVPEIPSQWQQGTEPGVTAVTTVFGNTAWPAPSSDPGGPQPPQARPPAPANTAWPAPSSDPGGPQPPQARPPAPTGHEQVVFCHDAPTGLRAIIAIYSTALGPALGGTRFYPYPSEDAALAAVLNLARAMAYKNALPAPHHAAAKPVIIADPPRH